MPVDPLSAAALLISLVSLGFSIESRWNDRHKLRCVARMSTTYGPGQETYEIEVDVTNLGRRPVSVVTVLFKDNEADLDEGEYAISSPIYGGIVDKGAPIELTENQTKSFSTCELTRDELLKKTKRIDVVVCDSRGESYVNTIDNDAYMGAEIEAEAERLTDEEIYEEEHLDEVNAPYVHQSAPPCPQASRMAHPAAASHYQSRQLGPAAQAEQEPDDHDHRE